MEAKEEKDDIEVDAIDEYKKTKNHMRIGRLKYGKTFEEGMTTLLKNISFQPLSPTELSKRSGINPKTIRGYLRIVKLCQGFPKLDLIEMKKSKNVYYLARFTKE